MKKALLIKDISSLLGKEFEIESSHEVAFDENHYIYTIAAYMGNQVLIKWKSCDGLQEKTTYTKQEVIDLINQKIWILK